MWQKKLTAAACREELRGGIVSVKVIAQLNLFSQERREWECESQNVAQILEKIDVARTVDTGWRVMVNDLPVTDFSAVANDGDTVYIKLVPEGDNQSQGAGMKAGGWVMVVLGTILAIATSWTGIGAFAGMALIGAGIGMATSGHVLYNLDIPDINNKEREQPEQAPSIRGSENQSRPLGTIPTLLGRRRIYPDLAANNYTWVDSKGDQYLYQLFCLGQAEQEIDTDTLKIDETLLKDYSASGDINKILDGTDELINVTIHQGKDKPPMMTRCVHEIQLNTILRNKTEEGQDGSIIRTTPDNTTGIHVDVFFYNGLGKYNDDGDVVQTEVKLRALYKRADQDDSHYTLLNYFNYGIDGSNSFGSNIISGNELKTKRYMATHQSLPPASYTVKVMRVTKDSEDNKVVDAVYVGSIRALKDESPVSPERCRLLTLMGVRIKVSEKLNNVIKQLNVESQAKLPAFSGTGTGLASWPYAKSSNPASAAIYAMTGGFSQQKLRDPEIDWPSFQKLYQWCRDKGYECNEYIAESMPISTLLTRIASTCRSEIIRMNGKITVIQDIEKPAPVQLFTPRNSHGYTESIVMGDLPDAMSLQYTDEEAGFAKNELTIYNTASGNKEAEPETTQDVPLWGVTSSVQARKLGMYKYAVSKNRPVVAKFSCDFEYLLCNKGDRIRYAGDIALTGISQGRIARLEEDAAGRIVGVQTDEALPMEGGKSYGLRVRRQDSSIALHQIVTREGESKQASLVTAVAAGSLMEGDLFTFGLLNNDSKEFLITDITCGENLSADITCTEYAPEIFGVDDPGFVLPDYDPKITATPAVMDAGSITLSHWQTWFTYHDQVTEPAKPTGDGSTNGWHRLATAQSMWVSTKTAKSITDGEWSQPYPNSSLVLEELMNGRSIAEPDVPVLGTVTAQRDGISISIIAPPPGINNSIEKYVAAISKGDGSKSSELEFIGLTATYSFYRPTDGYPEAADLDKWSVRVKAVNTWGKESGWSQETAPNTDTYGTWQLAAPKVVPQVKDRHITLLFSQPQRADGRQVYGDVTHAITIRRPDVDTNPDTWYTPGTSLNPYPETAGDGTERTNEGNYRLDTTVPETRGEMYVQTMPLKGQGGDGKGIENTLYLFRVVATNEAGESPATTVQAVALCTNIVDLVNANVTQKEAYVPDLSAISANLGSINQGGMGNDNNRWDLSTFVDPKGIQRWEGLFRVGSPNQYLHVNPIINDIGQIIDYEIIFKVGKFELSSTASNIKGEVIVMADDRPWERTRITPTGTYYEYLPSQEAGWQTVAKQETRGLMSQLMYSGQSIILTNSSITQRRRNGIDLGRPYLSEHSLVYHFDEDFLDQHGNRGYTLEGQAQLVDMDDNTPLVPIDFTAAILSVAPYSEVGKSAYGQFSITHPLGSSNVFTVDFWIQYIWAENQVLLDIGVPSDRIQIICSSGEPNYNEPQDGEPPYNWEIESADKLPYNVAAGSAVYANHQGIGSFDTIDLEDIGFEFTPNTWEHLAVVLTDTEITLYLRDRRLPFTRYGTGIQEATAILNAGEMSFQLDEMLVDTTMARDFDDFVAGTHDKVPWAALDHNKKHYILDAAEPDNITGNLFTSRTFEKAVLRVLETNKEST